MMTMNKFINTAVKILFGIVFGFFFVIFIQSGIKCCSNVPTNTEEQAQLEEKIKQHLEQIQVLYDSIDRKQDTIDSLRNERNRIDTIWKTKIVALNELSFSGQYEVLKSNLDTTCHMILGKKLYFYEGDTLLGLNQPELLCINESFYHRYWCEEAYASAMDELMETNNLVDIWKSISSKKDTLISTQDSLIQNQSGIMSGLKKQNKNLKRGLFGTGLALLLTLILK